MKVLDAKAPAIPADREPSSPAAARRCSVRLSEVTPKRSSQLVTASTQAVMAPPGRSSSLTVCASAMARVTKSRTKPATAPTMITAEASTVVSAASSGRPVRRARPS